MTEIWYQWGEAKRHCEATLRPSLVFRFHLRNVWLSSVCYLNTEMTGIFSSGENTWYLLLFQGEEQLLVLRPGATQRDSGHRYMNMNYLHDITDSLSLSCSTYPVLTPSSDKVGLSLTLETQVMCLWPPTVLPINIQTDQVGSLHSSTEMPSHKSLRLSQPSRVGAGGNIHPWHPGCISLIWTG